MHSCGVVDLIDETKSVGVGEGRGHMDQGLGGEGGRKRKEGSRERDGKGERVGREQRRKRRNGEGCFHALREEREKRHTSVP